MSEVNIIRVPQNEKFEKTQKCKKTTKTVFASILFVFAIIGMILAILVAWIYGETLAYQDVMSKWQIQRMIDLQTKYANGEILPVDEQQFADFDLGEANLYKFNQTRYVATHNSYKAKEVYNASKFTNAMFGAFTSVGSKGFSYSFDDLTTQLNTGIRSVELDAFAMNDSSFLCCHHAVTDVNTYNINLDLAFEEINMWSNNNPNHLPITILIEAKTWLGFSRADGHEFKLDDLKNLEFLAKNRFVGANGQSKLIQPKDMLRDYATFKDMRTTGENGDWLSMDKMLGKVVVILHPGKTTGDYVDYDPTMQKQAMFPACGDKKEFSQFDIDRMAFALCNDPIEETVAMTKFRSENFFVRTRVDIYPHFSNERVQKALESGANIVSTDFPPSKFNPNDDKYVFTFANGKMASIV